MSDTEQKDEANARVERSAALVTLAITREEERSERANEVKNEPYSESVIPCQDTLNVVKLRVGGERFEVEKDTLLRVTDTYFYAMLSSGSWKPDADGVYSIDRPAIGFERILDYLRSGKLRVGGLTESEKDCIYSNLDYFLIPYIRPWEYDTHALLKGFKAFDVFQLKDGRLCGAFATCVTIYEITESNMDTNAIETKSDEESLDYIPVHDTHQIFQLQDGRVCTTSGEETHEGHIIQLWNIDSGKVEMNLQLYEQRVDEVTYVVQLSDGRLCAGYIYWHDQGSGTIAIWNVSTGECELSEYTRLFCTCTIAQLADGRICCGHTDGTISIHSLLDLECELSFGGHATADDDDDSDYNENERISAIVCIDSTTICCLYQGGAIRVWNIATGACVRTLEDPDSSYTVVFTHVERLLCSTSSGHRIKLWNLDTGECVRTLESESVSSVVPMQDKRLCSTFFDESGEEENLGTSYGWAGALERHSKLVSSVVPMQDGRLCTCTYNGNIKLWNLETGECEKTLKMVTSNFGSCRVLQLADGRLVSYDGGERAYIHF